MTAIKHTLQRQVFLPCEERLVSVVHVTKAGKKKKSSFLCAAVTTEKPIQALIYQLKKSERAENVYKKKRSWTLRELKTLDAKEDEKEGAEFEMLFEKTFKWIASSVTEKNAFIQCLWKLSERYLVQKVEFMNVPKGLLEDMSKSSEADQSVAQVEEQAADTDWQALTQREETDLNRLMESCNDAISNAETFAETLSQDLSVLDGANIHSIMGSEDQVMALMVQLDSGLQEAVQLEELLDNYNQKLQVVKEMTEIMRDKDSVMQARNRNHEALLATLDCTITELDLPNDSVKSLLDVDLTSQSNIKRCCVAALELKRCINAQIHPSLEEMAAVREQRKLFKQLTSSLSRKLCHHLNNLFVHQGNEYNEAPSDLKLPSHLSNHRNLLPYTDLMDWLKVAEPDKFNALLKNYCTSLQKVYERELKELSERLKSKLVPKMERRGTGHRLVHAGSASSLNKSADLRLKPVTTLIDSEDLDVNSRTLFDQLFEHLISEIEPWCLAEQDFCSKFFILLPSGDAPAAELPWVDKKSAQKRRLTEEVRRALNSVFATMEKDINDFIYFGDSMDSFNSLYMLVRMSQHVSLAEEQGSFLNKLLASCLVQIKRHFDSYIQRVVKSYEDFRGSKKSKIGIISFVYSFEEFASQAEAVFHGSSRRVDLDKAYHKLITAIFEQIRKIAEESSKSPKAVVMFENLHHIHGALQKLKITSLEQQKKLAKSQYQDWLNVYVQDSLGHPMEKLNEFFEGIENKVKGGVKESEVSYQLAFSKQELRKVIKGYPAKDVKKSLEQLYKKVEKHLSEEEGLLQVVWHSMQDEFLRQYQHFDQLITRCYPDSGINLEFTIQDLLTFFSNIAQSH